MYNNNKDRLFKPLEETARWCPHNNRFLRAWELMVQCFPDGARVFSDFQVLVLVERARYGHIYQEQDLTNFEDTKGERMTAFQAETETNLLRRREYSYKRISESCREYYVSATETPPDYRVVLVPTDLTNLPKQDGSGNYTVGELLEIKSGGSRLFTDVDIAHYAANRLSLIHI